MSALLILGIVLVAGSAGGWLAARFGVPRVTGNIVAGVLMAVTIFREIEVARVLQPLSTFAISLIAVTAGGHFSYRRLHNSLRRILYISFFEVLFAVGLVYLTLSIFPVSWPIEQVWPLALILSVLAASTAPGTSVAIIRENYAKGPAVKTLLAVVSVDSSLCILLFAFVHSLLAAYFVHGEMDTGLAEGILQAARQLIGSAVLGVGLGIIASTISARYSRRFCSPRASRLCSASALS